MNGVLVVDKPAGPTSHDVVARVRRALGLSRVGHTGTLDPLATGVLPVVVGHACRLAQFLSSAEKEYLAVIRLGATTPTYDAEGLTDADLVESPPPDIPLEVVEATLAGLRGSYLQTPPQFSAKKIGGVPAYQLARADQPAAVRPVPVTVRALDLHAYGQGVVRIRLVCSSGFYVRSLAHELGQRLGCGGYLASLRRTRAGEFGLDRAVPLDVIQSDGTNAARHMVPLDALLATMPSVRLTESGARRARHGRVLSPADWTGALGSDGTRVRLLEEIGTLVGIADRRPDGLLHPAIVLG